MRLPIILSVLLTAVSSASAATCARDERFEGRSFVLWLQAGANPDESACAARMSYTGCSDSTTPDGVTVLGEVRSYRSADYKYIADFTIATDGAISVTIRVRGANGLTDGALTFSGIPPHRLLQRGMGADSAVFLDRPAMTRKERGAMHLIPAENLTDAANALCPGR